MLANGSGSIIKVEIEKTKQNSSRQVMCEQTPLAFPRKGILILNYSRGSVYGLRIQMKTELGE